MPLLRCNKILLAVYLIHDHLFQHAPPFYAVFIARGKHLVRQIVTIGLNHFFNFLCRQFILIKYLADFGL